MAKATGNIMRTLCTEPIETALVIQELNLVQIPFDIKPLSNGKVWVYTHSIPKKDADFLRYFAQHPCWEYWA